MTTPANSNPQPAGRSTGTAATPPRQANPRLRHALLLGALLLTATAFAATFRPLAQDQVTWQHDLSQARQTSAQTGKPVLMYFTAQWCPGCHAMRAYIFGEETIAADIMRDTVPVKVDMTRTTEANQPIAQQYRADMLPLLVLTDADGREIARYTQGAWPDQFSPWLVHATAEADAPTSDPPAAVSVIPTSNNPR